MVMVIEMLRGQWLGGRSLLFSFGRRSLLGQRSVSSQSCNKVEGIRVKFDENEARLHFDRWLKSLW